MITCTCCGKPWHSALIALDCADQDAIEADLPPRPA